MKTYQEIVDYIYSIPKFTSKNTMEHTSLFYAFLKQPGNNLKIIHVAGTNGKGSVCAYINQIFMESEHLVGMFTSPHLVCMEERFQINGKKISQEEFTGLFHILSKEVIRYQKKNPTYYPTFFEFLFFMAMVYFEEKKVEVIILETGLGGRLDATNIISNPIVSVITKIGLDHTEYLGNSITEIATEKAGIIKKNVPVVFWSDNEEVNTVISRKAKEKNAKLYPINLSKVEVNKNRDKNIDFSYNSSYYRCIHCKLNNTSLYQVENALLAIRVFEVIRKVFSVEKKKIQIGLSKTKWPGRMEEAEPNIYLDGAHNVDGIQAMLRGIHFKKGEKKILLFSVVKDKNYEAMISELAKKNQFNLICITKIPGERGLETEKIKKIVQKYTKIDVLIIEDVKEAFEYCKKEMQKNKETQTLYVVGSLYLIGLIKEILEKTKIDSDTEESI